MESYLIKLKHILPTYLFICVGSVLLLGFFRWIFCIQFFLLNIKEEMWEIWIPSIFPCIPITLWLRQRFRILTFKKDYDNKRFYYQLLSWISIMAVSIIFQNYLTTATGKLNKIKTIDEIEKLEPVRYYEISKFQINQNKEGIYIEIRKSGKRNNRLNYDFYVVFPILKDSLNKQSFKTNYWYGLKFQKQISN